MVTVKINKITLLYQISEILVNKSDLKNALENILRIMSEGLDFMSGMLTIFNRKTGQIFIKEAYGLSDEEKGRGVYMLGEGITGKVVETGEPIFISRVSDEPNFLNRTLKRNDLVKNNISFICVPVKNGSDVLGTLSADHPYSDDNHLHEDIKFLSIISAMISQSVRLYQIEFEEKQELEEENERLQHELKERFRPSNIIGNSKSMRDVYNIIEKISGLNTTVLILGESGVGKELVAHAIHYNSPRNKAPFIKFNCAALPESIIESELFGHEKGSFSGAVNMRKGRFELADRGTIFLVYLGFSADTWLKQTPKTVDKIRKYLIKPPS